MTTISSYMIGFHIKLFIDPFFAYRATRLLICIKSPESHNIVSELPSSPRKGHRTDRLPQSQQQVQTTEPAGQWGGRCVG